MRFECFNTIFEYLDKWREAATAAATLLYRLAEVKQTAQGECTLVVQVIGKSTFLEFTPEALAADDQLLEGFSKRDIRTIIYFACEQMHRPKFKIRFQEFCHQFNRMIFRLQKLGSRETISKSAAEITLDKNLINHLSHEDVLSVSYTAGYEHSQIGIKPDQTH